MSLLAGLVEMVAILIDMAANRTLSRWIDRRVARRSGNVAGWKLHSVAPGPGHPGRGIVITNAGRDEARDLVIVVGGGGWFSLDGSFDLRRVRPGASIGLMLMDPGTGWLTLEWTNRHGARVTQQLQTA